MKRLNLLQKLALLAVVLIAGAGSLQAQIKVGDNPTVIDPSSLLELESKTKGLVLPRMNGSEMNAISAPLEGMLIYNTDSVCVCVRKGSIWRSICSLGNDSNWALLGNNGTNPATNFVGTKDAQGLSIRTNSLDRIHVDATGRVGVNNATPAYQLDIASAANPVRMTGMQGGGKNDSLVSIDAIGVLRKRTVNDVLADGLDAENGVNIDALNVIRLGGPLTQATTITTSSTNTLALPGLQPGFTTDSIIVADGTSGILRRRTVASVIGNAFTADNGLTKNTLNNVQLGGVLITPTTVTADVTNTMAFQGLQHGTVADSVVLANASTGVLRRAKMSDLLKNTIQAENGVNIDNNNIVRLGGPLTQATTITTDASNILSVAGLQHGTIADSVVLSTAASGTLRRARFSDLLSNSITADNGLTKTGNNIQLGGALISATTVTTTATNTLSIPGLQHGTIADSVVLANAATGTLRRANFADLLSNTITANNGLTKTGNNIQLGGTLVQNTAVDQGAFNQAFTSTTGNFTFVPSSTGKFGIGTAAPTQKLHVEGNLFVSGAMMTPSDIRLKDHITKLNYGLKEVLNLSTIHYDWKDRARFGDEFRIGVVAQEVQAAMPELVRVAKDEQKSLSVSYSEFAPVFINAIKELNGKIDGLKTENDALKAEVENLNNGSTSIEKAAAPATRPGEKK